LHFLGPPLPTLVCNLQAQTPCLSPSQAPSKPTKYYAPTTLCRLNSILAYWQSETQFQRSIENPRDWGDETKVPTSYSPISPLSIDQNNQQIDVSYYIIISTDFTTPTSTLECPLFIQKPSSRHLCQLPYK
jgi:hypothetical protein